MGFLYLLRSASGAALAANVVRPVRTYSTAWPSFFSGWLVGELAPHAIAFTAADGLRELTRGRKANKLGLALNAATIAALGYTLVRSEQSKETIERTLAEGLGSDYRTGLETVHDDLDPITPRSQLVWPFRVRSPKVRRIKDLVYDEGHGKRGKLDLVIPVEPRTDTAPVLLHVHGGAWMVGQKATQGVPLLTEMAAAGWVCVDINYRLSPGANWPDHIVDVKAAIAWVKEHIADYGGDPGFLAITGGSAGGHLAALAALTPNDPAFQPGFEDADTTVQACVPFYGVYDLAGASGRKPAIQMRDRFLGPRLFKKDPKTGLEIFEQASPLLRVNAEAPPFLVIHGTHDSLVDVDQARDFVAALRHVSKQPVLYAEISGAQHAFDLFPSIRSEHVKKAVDRFLRWTYAQHEERHQQQTDPA
ncbi:MAG: alpha/beta hydrolase [Nocardioidaceae bacterium]